MENTTKVRKPNKRKAFSEQDITEMVELYDKYKFSCKLIGTMFDCAKNTVRDRLIKAGVKFDKVEVLRRAWKNNLTVRKPKSKVSAEGCRNMSKAFRKLALNRLGITDEDHLDELTIKQQTRFIRQALQMVIISKNSVKARLLGYTHDEIVKFITERFREGMSWEDRKSFHVDHIIPIRLFVHKGVLELDVINSFANLQVLYPKENLTKHCKYDSSNFEADLEMLRNSIK